MRLLIFIYFCVHFEDRNYIVVTTLRGVFSIYHIVFNSIIQLVLGIPLELVHKSWRIGIVYLLGVTAGVFLILVILFWPQNLVHQESVHNFQKPLSNTTSFLSHRN